MLGDHNIRHTDTRSASLGPQKSPPRCPRELSRTPLHAPSPPCGLSDPPLPPIYVSSHPTYPCCPWLPSVRGYPEFGALLQCTRTVISPIGAGCMFHGYRLWALLASCLHYYVHMYGACLASRPLLAHGVYQLFERRSCMIRDALVRVLHAHSCPTIN